MSMAAIFKNHPLQVQKKVVFHSGAICLLLIVLVGYVFRSCGKQVNNSSKNNSFLTGARMSPALFAPIDTLNKDSLLQVEYGRYIDSVLKHTSISDFNSFIEGGVSVKDYPTLKYTDAINAFIRQQQQVFLSKRKK